MEVNAETIAPKPEGLPAETGSQEQKPPEQSGASGQEGQQGAVEAPKPVTTSKPDAEGQKPKPRDWYRQREEQKKLFQTVTSMNREIQELRKHLDAQNKAPAPAPNGKPETRKGFWDDADGWTQTLEQKVEQMSKMIENLQNGLPNQLESYEKQKEFQKADQEVTGLVAKAGLTEEQVAEFVTANGFGEAYLKNPRKVWEKIIAPEFGIKTDAAQKPPTNPNVPTKAQMGTTAAGVPAQSQQPTQESLRSTLREMTLQRAAKPQLRFDANFNAKIAEIEKQLMSKPANKS